MQKENQSIDITNIPDLLRLAEEVQATKKPRLLKRGDEGVAMLTPLEPAAPMARSQFRDLAHRLAGSLADVDIPGWETSEAAERWVEELRRGDMFPFEPPEKP